MSEGLFYLVPAEISLLGRRQCQRQLVKTIGQASHSTSESFFLNPKSSIVSKETFRTVSKFFTISAIMGTNFIFAIYSFSLTIRQQAFLTPIFLSVCIYLAFASSVRSNGQFRQLPGPTSLHVIFPRLPSTIMVTVISCINSQSFQKQVHKGVLVVEVVST